MEAAEKLASEACEELESHKRQSSEALSDLSEKHTLELQKMGHERSLAQVGRTCWRLGIRLTNLIHEFPSEGSMKGWIQSLALHLSPLTPPYSASCLHTRLHTRCPPSKPP